MLHSLSIENLSKPLVPSKNALMMRQSYILSWRRCNLGLKAKNKGKGIPIPPKPKKMLKRDWMSNQGVGNDEGESEDDELEAAE